MSEGDRVCSPVGPGRRGFEQFGCDPFGHLQVGVVPHVGQFDDVRVGDSLPDRFDHGGPGNGIGETPDEPTGDVRALQGAGPAVGQVLTLVGIPEQAMSDALSAPPRERCPMSVEFLLGRFVGLREQPGEPPPEEPLGEDRRQDRADERGREEAFPGEFAGDVVIEACGSVTVRAPGSTRQCRRRPGR